MQQMTLFAMPHIPSRQQQLVNWMCHEVRNDGYLSWPRCAEHIRTNYGMRFFSENALGYTCIAGDVRRAFNKAMGGEVCWVSGLSMWKLRSYDKPQMPKAA